jgi:hypothetical protein
MRHSRRFWVPVCFVIFLLLILSGKSVVAAGNHVVLIWEAMWSGR